MSTRKILRIGLLAGLAGGVAEVGWVAGYAALTGASSAAVARGVTAAILPALSASTFGVGLGITLHMLLAVGLGVAVAATFSGSLLRRIGDWPRCGLVVLMLGMVWALNFLVVLPVLHPGFLTLLPPAATLVSKLLFGIAAAATFRIQHVGQGIVMRSP
jgi:hypothetical protein